MPYKIDKFLFKRKYYNIYINVFNTDDFVLAGYFEEGIWNSSKYYITHMFKLSIAKI